MKTEVKLNFDKRVVVFSTLKNSRGQLATTATVGVSSNGFFSFVIFQDFYKVLASEPCARSSKKKIEAQHNMVLESLPSIVEEIRAFYGQPA